MILLIGSLELIWSAHESSVWSDEGDPMEHKTMRAALRDHQRLLDAIRDGNEARAVKLAQDHLSAARRNTLAVGADKTIEAKLISNADEGLSMTTTDDRVLFDVDRDKRIATITFNNPSRRNSYDAAMRETVGRYLDQVAEDDDLTVVLLRGAEGVFSTGADMNNAYGWYGDEGRAGGQTSSQSAAAPDRRPQVVRLLSQPDGLPEGHSGGDQRLRARRWFRDGVDDRHIRDRAQYQDRHARYAVPRPGAGQPAHVLPSPRSGAGAATPADRRHHRGRRGRTPRGVHRHLRPRFGHRRARYWAEKAAKMPADGVVIAKEAFRLVEQSQAYAGEEVASYLFHAYGTNLQFAPGEFNFVKTRAQHGTKEAFRLRDEHFHVPEPE